jgi:hypothetical protein
MKAGLMLEAEVIGQDERSLKMFRQKTHLF